MITCTLTGRYLSYQARKVKLRRNVRVISDHLWRESDVRFTQRADLARPN
jgi:hypothetical protein